MRTCGVNVERVNNIVWIFNTFVYLAEIEYLETPVKVYSTKGWTLHIGYSFVGTEPRIQG